MSSNRQPYVESTIIMTAVRIVAPFTMTFGLFVTLHGADSPGGGFQGGAIIGATIIMIAFAFGIEPTREWIRNAMLTSLMSVGVTVFALIGLGAMAFDGAFLEYTAYGFDHASKYGIELVEVAIGAIVASVITGLFFVVALGFNNQGEYE